jgi:hypothetical protein
MATVTPNFNWPVPTSGDLVKNGATAIEALGDGIDASFVDLKGGTTGQVLSKASNTDLDYSWVTTDDANAIQNSIVDAKGDLIAATANDTPARLAVGANDLLLTAASGEATGLKYTGGWTTWSPSYIDLTIGNGTVVARYQQIGKTVNYFWRLTWGSTTSCTSFVRISFPVTASYLNYVTGRLVMDDSGAATYLGVPYMNTLGFYFLSENTAGTYNNLGPVNATSPATWTTNDKWTISGSYEVA